MEQRFKRVFGDGKPVIGMVHLGALPGSPLYDEARGIAGLVEAATQDLAALRYRPKKAPLTIRWRIAGWPLLATSGREQLC